MSAPATENGRRLLDLLPELYEHRDETGDLAGFLDACGELLDRIQRTLEQRLADCFPDNPPEGPACQDWLLPYFARLVDARLVSPHVEGRREEVGNAVAWRKLKGTARVIEEVAEAIGRTAGRVPDVVLHEGFERVAVTPRVDRPLVPATALGAETEPDMSHPSSAARHPGLPAVTVEVSRPVTPRTAPCFPGNHADRLRRTVDVRTPDWANGHHHPKRVLLFAPVPAGFFPREHAAFKWSERNDEEHRDHFSDVAEDGNRLLSNPSAPAAVTLTTSPPQFDVAGTMTVEDLNFDGTLTVRSGRVRLVNVAAKKIVVRTESADEPVLDAVDCLFDSVLVEDGLVRLEACTVMRRLTARGLFVSDSLLPDAVVLTATGDEPPGCVRYSRAPQFVLDLDGSVMRTHQVTTDRPAFFDHVDCGVDDGRRPLVFGEPGYGVLHPATPESVCFGAEDGGEVGAYHARRHCLTTEAVLLKLADFLPLGIEAVIVPDRRLLWE